MKNINFNVIFLKNIKKISKSCKFEICGGVTSKKMFLWPNKSLNPKKGFFVDPLKYCKIIDEIEYFFHSHPFSSAKPSKIDLIGSEEIDKPFLIYSNIKNNFCFYSPKHKKSIYFCL